MHNKQVLSAAGKLLGAAGLFFVFYTLFQHYTLETFAAHFTQILPILPVLFVVNIISTLLGIYAWHIMLLNYAAAAFSYKTSYYYFAKTEIAKYLPGNLFHFVGRQALASSIGITQKAMAKISVFFAFLLIAATLFSSTLFAFFSTTIPLYILTLMGVSCMITAIVVYYTYPSFPFAAKIRMNLMLSMSVMLQGVMMGIVVTVQHPNMTAGLFFESMSIYIISWLIGFVTPGASGGLGVREGAFIAVASFLHVNIASEVIVFSVLLIRLVNIIVDIMMYLSTLAVKTNIKGLET